MSRICASKIEICLLFSPCETNTMQLNQLVYASAAANPFSQAELRGLLSKARARNSTVGITGLLLYHNQSFFQILEGEEEDTDSIFARIGRDPRHNRILLLSKKNIEERNFGDWSMGFVDLEQSSNQLTGFVKLMDAQSSFLDLHGDTEMVGKLIDGFQQGRWRQSVS